MTKDGTTAAAQKFSTLKLKSLTNNGQIIMDVSPDNNQLGDQIVTTDASGNGTIKANIPASELNAAGTDYLEASTNPLITVTGTDTSNYTVSNNGTNRLEVGNWTYSLQKYTYTDGAGVQQTGYRLTNSSLLSNKGATVVSALVSPDYWYDETNALYSDLNNFTTARKDHDLWAHGVHSKLTVKDRDVAVANGADLDTKYDGVVFGYDKKISQTKRGTFWAGVMAGYGRGNSDFSEGDADTDSAHIGVYGVYRTTSDWYLGGIMKYNHYKTDVDSYTTAGSASSIHTSDNLSQNGWGLSIMGGKRFHNSKGWFVEPQLEFGFHRIGEGDYDLGAEHVNVDAVTSKRLRAGIGFGKSLLYKNGSSLDVFAQASLVHEFGADNTVTTSNSLSSSGSRDRFDVDYGGTWGQYKLGVNYNTVKGDNVIFALTYNKGGHRSSPLGFEVTYNWTF